MKENKFVGNLKYALIAQTTATLFSMMMYLLVPKIMGAESYGYWQLFLLYSNYSGFFHLGLIDGIYLKIGGQYYDRLDKSLLGTQLKILIGIHFVLAILVIQVIIHSTLEWERIFVIVAFTIYVIFYTIQNFLGLVIQAVNETKVYSMAVIIEKGICLIGTVILIALKKSDFRYFIVLAVMGIGVNSLFLLIKKKDIALSGLFDFISTIVEMKNNIAIGSVLMFAGIASTFIIGSGRMIVDHYWGIEAFGKISFAISMINMLLLFIRQVSVVLFPTLRQMNFLEQVKVYKKIIDNLSVLLPWAYMAYIPMKVILRIWLPQYDESIKFLSLLLPICLYDGKMQMIFNTYFKVFRKERKLLFVNITSLCISIGLCFAAALYFNDICVVAVALVLGIAIRSMICEVYLNKKLGYLNELRELFYESLFAIVFMYCAWNFNNFIVVIALTSIYLVYIAGNKKKRQIIKEDFKFVRNRINFKKTHRLY
ncbi:MAG TPA: hypothetical protein DDW53_22025 [Lachnoclostridium sp.]|nr:hypothetical protein [Lachnoclostridium sp.]